MKILYFNTENLYPHDTHLIDGFRQAGHEVIEVCEKKDNFSYKSLIKKLRNEGKGIDTVFVGFPTPNLAILARLFTTKKIIFNAVSSQYEANVISRGNKHGRTLSAFKSWVIDMLSFHLSTKILLESKEQIEFIHKFFHVPLKKLVLSYSGLNEKDFYFEPSVAKKEKFTVLFRGRFLPESGILTVVEAAKILENHEMDFLIIGHGFLYREFNALMDKLKPKNITHIHDPLPMSELRHTMLACHISLGQLADHPRLLRTLPMKLFESLALKLPYVSGRNKAALEILKDGENCVVVEPGNAQDLAKKILYLKENPKIRESIGEKGYELYKTKLSPKVLALGVLRDCGLI